MSRHVLNNEINAATKMLNSILENRAFTIDEKRQVYVIAKDHLEKSLKLIDKMIEKLDFT